MRIIKHKSVRINEIHTEINFKYSHSFVRHITDGAVTVFFNLPIFVKPTKMDEK